MSRRRKGAAPAAPDRLHSLTGQQLELLREAAEKAPRGAYVPISGGHAAGELVEGGAAEWREVQQTSSTPRSASDARPCTWTDLYVVPTPWGLELLKRAAP